MADLKYVSKEELDWKESTHLSRRNESFEITSTCIGTPFFQNSNGVSKISSSSSILRGMSKLIVGSLTVRLWRGELSLFFKISDFVRDLFWEMINGDFAFAAGWENTKSAAKADSTLYLRMVWLILDRNSVAFLKLFGYVFFDSVACIVCRMKVVLLRSRFVTFSGAVRSYGQTENGSLLFTLLLALTHLLR